MAGVTKPGPLSCCRGTGTPQRLPWLERAERGGAVLRGGSAPWTAAPRQTAPLRPAAAPAAEKQGPGEDARTLPHWACGADVFGFFFFFKKKSFWQQLGGCVLVSFCLWQRDPTGCKGWVVTDAVTGAGALGTVLLSPVTGLHYRAHANSIRSNKNQLCLRQGSSPAQPAAAAVHGVPRANLHSVAGVQTGINQVSSSSSSVTLDGGENLLWVCNRPGQQTGPRGDFMHGGGQRKKEQTSPGF